MKPVRLTFAILISSILLWAGGCAKESKHKSDIQTIKRLIRMVETLLKNADQAPNPLSFRNALSKFVSEYKSIKTEITAFEKKYPDFKTINGEKGAPKELQPLIKRFYSVFSHSQIIIEAKVNKYKRFSGLKVVYKEFKEILYYY